MNKDFIKEALSNHRLTKTLLWNTLIVISGGMIGLFFRIINTKGLVEIFLSFWGFFVLCLVVYFINVINQEISKLMLFLKEYKDK